MKDLKLDFINKTVIDAYVDDKDRVVQQIKLAVQTWIEDWGLDETFGIDYDNAWYSNSLMEFYVRKMILQVDGVSQIDTFSLIKEEDDNGYITYFIKVTIVLNGEVVKIDPIGVAI